MPFAVVETGQHYATLQEAVSSIRLGTGTILIAPGTYRDCAVQQGGRITFRAATPGSVIFQGGACEGKATLVLRGTASVVDGLVFRDIHVGDGNGAGVRTEMGDLTVMNSMFLDSQEGILGGQPTGQRITIDRSTFSGLGQCDQTPDCAHSIYLANKGRVTITNSRFERGRGGHYVKLRVPNVVITDNSFDDTGGRKTNYMIDLPEGATGLIARNTFVQGRAKENPFRADRGGGGGADLSVDRVADRGQRRATVAGGYDEPGVRGGSEPRSAGGGGEPARAGAAVVRDAVSFVAPEGSVTSADPIPTPNDNRRAASCTTIVIARCPSSRKP